MKINPGVILILCLLSNILFAHTIKYDYVVFRHWQITEEKKTVDGSFFMYKDGEIFIEDANNKIIHYPLSYFSQEDQAYALKKDAWVKGLNINQAIQNMKPAKTPDLFDYRFLIIVLILAVLGTYFLKVADKRRLKYLIPILFVGVALTLLSFTGKVMKRIQSTTDPLSVDSAFTPFKPNVYTRWDATWFYVESKGIPATHNMMVGISNHGWQQQVPIPQCYTGSNAWSIPLNPVMATTPIPVDSVHFTRGAIALAINGVPIFNEHTNTGVDSYTDGQLDNFGGHCGRADDYHYHIAPLSLYNYTSATMPIAYALDGFAVYGSKEPDGASMQALDANHGHLFQGVYHYHGTTTYPYMIGRMAGQVTEDGTHQLIPQAAAHPVRPSLTPLNGALITSCLPNPNNNGYSLIYTLNGQTDSIVYSWTAGGLYTFHYYYGTGDSVKTYNGFSQCSLPTGIDETYSIENAIDIYPNPATDGFILRSSKEFQEKDVQGIAVYNLEGKLIFKTEHFEQNIAVTNLAKGIYLVKIHVTNSELTRKLVVQ